MGIVTVGNLIILGLCILAIFAVRYKDRHNHSVDLAREYGRRLKEEIASFTEEKAALVKDNGLLLDVQMSSIKEALNRLVQAHADLNEKAETTAGRIEEVTRIGDRINAYDSSMEELIRMAAKVEENMARLREESERVEKTAKKAGEIEERFGKLEQDMDGLEKNLGGLEDRFEQENTVSLEKAAETLLSQVRSSVENLQASAETVERQVEQHREAVDRIETDRKALLERDVDIINKTLSEALERAAGRAGKLEEEAMVKLREETMVRVRRFQDAVEEKFREYHENAKAKAAEIQAMVKNYQDGWKEDQEKLEEERKEYQTAWQRDLEALDALALSQRTQWEAAMADTEQRIARLGEELGAKTAEAEEKLLRDVDRRLEEYRDNQKHQWERFETMADDALKLDGQLRLVMEDAEARVRSDFAVFADEQKQSREQAGAAFNESVEVLKGEISALESELEVLKNRAYDNVSEKLKLFEDDFFADMSRRSTEIDGRFNQWQSAMEQKLSALGEEAEAERRSLELSFKDELGSRISGQSEQILSDLERLRIDAAALEEKIQNGLEETESSVSRRSTEIDGRFNEWQSAMEQKLSALEEEAEAERRSLELSFKDELDTRIGGQSERILSDLERLKIDAAALAEKIQNGLDETESRVSRRSTEIDGRFNQWQSAMEQKLAALGEEAETERRSLELSFRNELDARVGEQSERILSDLERLRIDAAAFEEKIQNGLDETESRVSRLSTNLEDIRRELKEFSSQTRLFEKTDELKTSLERSMETLKDEMAGIEERRTEAARLETEFIKIRRLEDEVNSKMTRFLSEKNHLDIMEKDFDRLVQISQRVEERLKEVTGADDTLQGIQVALRKLEDAIAVADEKYLRIEKKNHILEETNSSIERNFQIMEETEAALRKCRENIDKAGAEIDSFRPAIEELAEANEKARNTTEKLGILDTGLKIIEERIEKMQTAREWLARAETRFEEIHKEVQEELKLVEAVLKDESKKSKTGKGAPAIAVRENVIRLRRQGWEAEEIARNLNIARGEVELILEMPIFNSEVQQKKGDRR
jgi:DNA repair exonuclease SbcCD ATPase subunit